MAELVCLRALVDVAADVVVVVFFIGEPAGWQFSRKNVGLSFGLKNTKIPF